MEEKDLAQSNDDTGENTPPAPPPETKPTDATPPQEGADKTPVKADNEAPFHEDPRIQDYLDRQMKKHDEEWEKRLKDQEERFSADIEGIRKEVPPKKEEKIEMPIWWAGDEKQWDAYVADQQRLVDRATEKSFERIQQTREAEAKATDDANKWFESSITSIEKQYPDKKIDRNALLDTVLNHEPREEMIDVKGRWNYRYAYQIMRSKETGAPPPPPPDPARADRKNLADASTRSDSGTNKGEKEKEEVTTSEDFRNPAKRPW